MSQPHYLHPDTLIIIFAREPVYGQVKTRLIPVLGKSGATELYRQMLAYTIRQHTHGHDWPQATILAPVSLCITPESRASFFHSMEDLPALDCFQQRGDDIGLRMYHAFQVALKNYQKVILIGTDCPFLTSEDVRQAIISLENHDVVLSPASDGGYVLIAAKKPILELFQHIDWGTERVMAQTRQVMETLNLSWKELPEKNDIDVKGDLRYLKQHTEFKEYNFEENP